MRWLATRRLRLSAIVLPGEIAALRDEPRIAERADSIAATGGEPINLPVVRHRPAMTGAPGTFALIIGRDRTAAIIRSGGDAMDVRVVECSDAEAAELEIIENLHRRNDDRDELLRRLVALRTERAPDQSAAAEPKAAGRPRTPRGAAREQVAAELHTTTEAVRAAERRAERANDPTKNETATPAAPAEHAPVAGAGLETWGLPIDGEQSGAVAAVNAALDRGARKLRDALGQVDHMRGTDLGRAIYTRIERDLRAAVDAVVAAQVAAVCPWCARIPRLQPTCGGCAGVGYVSDGTIAGIDERLKAPGKAKVVFDGGALVPFARAEKPATGMGSGLRATQAADRKRRLRVEMPDGSAYTPPADDVPPPSDSDGEELAF